MNYTREQRETIGAIAADALFASNGQTNTHADYGNESEALGAALGAYLAALDSRPERLADVITALLAPFGDAMTIETLLLLAGQHDSDEGYNFACRLAGQAIAKGGARNMSECVLHYMPYEVATWAAETLGAAGKHAERDVMLATAEKARDC